MTPSPTDTAATALMLGMRPHGVTSQELAEAVGYQRQTSASHRLRSLWEAGRMTREGGRRGVAFVYKTVREG